MATIIQNINTVYAIKNELNDILVENGQDGGPVLATYPDQFRALFKVLESSITNIETGPEEVVIQEQNVVLDPTINYYENVVSIINNSNTGTVYYRVVSSSGNNDRGWGEYTDPFYIQEDVYVESYVVVNSENSNTVWANVPYVKEEKPEAPVIHRTSNSISITCATQGADIWFSIDDGDYQAYTGLFSVNQYNTVHAYSTHLRKASDEVVSKGDPLPITPEVPVINYSNNIINITCATLGADIEYRFDGGEWVDYTGPILITETVVVQTKSVLNNIYSSESTPVECVYVPGVVSDPVISCVNNYVSISCATSGATIYYKKSSDSNYVVYQGMFMINQSDTYMSYAAKTDMTDSDVVSLYCEWVDIPVDSNLRIISDNSNQFTFDVESVDGTGIIKISRNTGYGWEDISHWNSGSYSNCTSLDFNYMQLDLEYGGSDVQWNTDGKLKWMYMLLGADENTSLTLSGNLNDFVKKTSDARTHVSLENCFAKLYPYVSDYSNLVCEIGKDYSYYGLRDIFQPVVYYYHNNSFKIICNRPGATVYFMIDNGIFYRNWTEYSDLRAFKFHNDDIGKTLCAVARTNENGISTPTYWTITKYK